MIHAAETPGSVLNSLTTNNRHLNSWVPSKIFLIELNLKIRAYDPVKTSLFSDSNILGLFNVCIFKQDGPPHTEKVILRQQYRNNSSENKTKILLCSHISEPRNPFMVKVIFASL